jgi:hypothetical protein
MALFRCNRWRPLLVVTVVALVLALVLMGCDVDDGLENDELNLWCGEELCGWDTIQGDVIPAETWHEHDTGVEFVGEEVILAQVVKHYDSDVCYFFDFLGLVEDDAQLFLEIDFADDDHRNPEISIPVNGEDWKPIFREVPLLSGYDEALIILRKTGKGRVILARIKMVSNYSCTGEHSLGGG